MYSAGPLAALALAGCSGILGIQDLTGPLDAGPVPAQVTVSGTVKINETGTPPYSTAVTLVRADGQIVASGMSSQQGAFTLTATTGGVPLDVALHVAASPPTSRDVYLYPPPLRADLNAGSITVLLDSDVANIVTSFGYNYARAMTLFVIDVRDARGAHLAGETIAPNVASVVVRYTTNGVPNAAFETSSDGLAYVFDTTTQVTMLTPTGPVPISPRRVRGVPASLMVVNLQP